MTLEEFKELYPDVEEDNIAPEQWNAPIRFTDPWDIIRILNKDANKNN